MKVTLAKTAGFCSGVRNAVEKAEKLVAEYGSIYIIGELVHNSSVVDHLEKIGAHTLDYAAAEILKEGDVALIRADGVPNGLEQKMRANGVAVFDATCPVVKRIHDLILERSKVGDDIVLVGDKEHDEVSSSATYAMGNITIVQPDKDMQNNLVLGDKPTSIVFQTTVLPEYFEKCDEFLKKSEQFCDKTFVIYNTVCYTTTRQQDELRTLARANDAVLVLGDKRSSNSRHLFEVAKEVNENSFFCDNLSEVELINKLKEATSIAITAGASTPPWLFQEVSHFMSEETKNTAIEAANDTAMTKESTSAAEKTSEKEITMEDVMASNHSVGFVVYKPGKRIRGTVISANDAGIFVTIGGKKDGFIDKAEASLDGNYNAADYKADDEIEAVITEVQKDYVLLSKKEIDAKLAEEAEAEKVLNAPEFELTMTEVVKGGLRGHIGGYTVFVPASQIKIGYVKNLEDYKDKTLRLMIMPPREKELPEGEEAQAEVANDKPERKSRYLFASQRMILEKEKKEKEDLFWDNIHVHDIVVGKVKRFTTFGAFVNVRGFDCLAHISELSWNKITDPSAVLEIGKEYDFVVLKMDRETGKISLGFKQLQKKPYEVAAETYPVGTVINGTVERIFPYGAFISISDGVDGLVHVSQISHKWIKDASEMLKVGDAVQAKIIGFEENRITLSIKDLLPPPEETEEKSEEEVQVSEGDDKARKVSRVKKFEARAEESAQRRDRRPRREDRDNEPKEWVSGSGAATLGDLLKGINLSAVETAEEAPVEEAPKKAAKKTTKKAVEAEAVAEEAEVAEAPKKTTRKKKAEVEEEK